MQVEAGVSFNISSTLNKLSDNNAYNFVRKNLPLFSSVTTGSGHIIAALADLFKPKSHQKADDLSLSSSKVLLSANCLIQTIEALKKNRIWEAIARFIEPMFILVEKNVEDLGLARGFGVGISQIVESQAGIHDEILKSENTDAADINFKKDHQLNWQAMKRLTKEILEGGIGKNRRFLTNFTWGSISEAFSNCAKDFQLNSIFELAKGGDARENIQAFFDKSGISHLKKLCVGNDERDKGHTAAFSGWMMIFGSILGYLNRAKRNFAYKLGGTARTSGGIIGLVSILGNPDLKHNIAAPFLGVSGVVEILQRFIPEKAKRMIKFAGNFSMAFYNMGISYYLNRSSDKTNDENVKLYKANSSDKEQTLSNSLDHLENPSFEHLQHSA